MVLYDMVRDDGVEDAGPIYIYIYLDQYLW